MHEVTSGSGLRRQPRGVYTGWRRQLHRGAGVSAGCLGRAEPAAAPEGLELCGGVRGRDDHRGRCGAARGQLVDGARLRRQRHHAGARRPLRADALLEADHRRTVDRDPARPGPRRRPAPERTNAQARLTSRRSNLRHDHEEIRRAGVTNPSSQAPTEGVNDNSRRACPAPTTGVSRALRLQESPCTTTSPSALAAASS